MAQRATPICFSCHGSIPTCMGAEFCPLVTFPIVNAQLLATGETATITVGPGAVVDGEQEPPITRAVSVLETTPVLPRSVSRVLNRACLEFLVTVARKPAPGELVGLPDLDITEMVQRVTGGSVSVNDAMSELVRRLGRPNISQADVARLNAVLSGFSNLAKAPGNACLVNPLDLQAAEFLGAFTLAFAMAGRVVTIDPAAMALAGETVSLGGESESKSVLQAKIIRPKSASQFFHLLTVWVMILHSTGLANPLASQAFLLKVIHEPLAAGLLTWTQAHESLLVHLEAIETQAVGSPVKLTIANVFAVGSADTFRSRAIQRAVEYFPPSARSGGADGFRSPATLAPPSGTRACLSFNLGKPCTNAKCPFAHRCDAYLTDGTQCGSTQHGRVNCDNPLRAAKAAKKSPGK